MPNNYPPSDYSIDSLSSDNADLNNPEYLQDLAAGCFGASFDNIDELEDDDYLYNDDDINNNNDI